MTPEYNNIYYFRVQRAVEIIENPSEYFQHYLLGDKTNSRIKIDAVASIYPDYDLLHDRYTMDKLVPEESLNLIDSTILHLKLPDTAILPQEVVLSQQIGPLKPSLWDSTLIRTELSLTNSPLCFLVFATPLIDRKQGPLIKLYNYFFIPPALALRKLQDYTLARIATNN